MRSSLVLPVLALLLSGCANAVTVTALNAPPRPLRPRAPSSVELVVEGQSARPSVAVAFVRVARSLGSLDGDLLGELRRRAAALGCDAIMVASSSSRAIAGEADKPIYGTCLVYRQGATATAPTR